MKSSAQGNALGIHRETIEARKGRGSFGCGASFALSGLETESYFSQGVVLGYGMAAPSGRSSITLTDWHWA